MPASYVKNWRIFVRYKYINRFDIFLFILYGDGQYSEIWILFIVQFRMKHTNSHFSYHFHVVVELKQKQFFLFPMKSMSKLDFHNNRSLPKVDVPDTIKFRNIYFFRGNVVINDNESVSCMLVKCFWADC